MLLGTVSSAGLRGRRRVVTRSSVVKVDSAVVENMAIHGLIGLGGSIGVGKVNIAEALAAAALAVGDDAGTSEALKVLEGLVQSVVVNAPAQAASKESGGAVASVCLAPLGSSIDLLVGLALL